MGKCRIDFRGWGWVFFAMLLLAVPIPWVVAAVSAATVHELAHGAAIRLCGGRIYSLEIGARGMRMETDSLSPGKELFCALAGPVGGLALLLLSRWIPRTAVCGAAQSLYNLLPIYPLDGGRALRCGAGLLLGEMRGRYICIGLETFCLTAILFLCIYGFFCLKTGLFPFLLFFLLLMKRKRENIPCNAAGFTVQ